MSDIVKAQVYLHVQPVYNQAKTKILSAKVIKMSQNKPGNLTHEAIPVLVSLDLPTDLFSPVRAHIVLTVDPPDDINASFEVG